MTFQRKEKLWDEPSLYDYAIGALGRRMRSVEEIKRLLRQKVAKSEYGTVLVDTVIARLKKENYLNDAYYAAAYSSLRRDNQKFGRRRVVNDLRSRGVKNEDIDTAVSAAYDDTNEIKLARDYLSRKRIAKPKDQKQAARVFRALLRAGFSSRSIIAILKKWDVEDEIISTLETEQE